MLLKREDLRNRLIRLVSHGQITVMTKALDDAGQRISRFLLMQLIVNATVGLSVGLGLLAIGVQYAFLWGFLAAVFRYVPYIGVWIAAVPPIILSLAMFEGWVQPLLVVGLFLTIELLAGNVAEPRLYGRSIGVSEVALLVAAAFWAFLWGPIGLGPVQPADGLPGRAGQVRPAVEVPRRAPGRRAPVGRARHLLPAAAGPRSGRGDATGLGAGQGIFPGTGLRRLLGAGLELCETGPRARRLDGIG